MQVLGLQRVGFNRALLDALLKAARKRERAAVKSRLGADALALDQPGPSKRTADEMEDEEERAAGPSVAKAPRLDFWGEEMIDLIGTGSVWDE